MDPPESESTLSESEVPSTKPVEFVSYGEWNDIYRAIIEQQVSPGTQFFQYKNRIVPLGWEPRPLVSITLPFGTVGEAMAHIGKARGETLSGVGTTAEPNVPTSSADNHSPEDTLSRVESAVSNLHIDSAQMSAVGETVSDVGFAPQSNVSTGSAGNHSPEDTSASVEEKTLPSGESASSNLHVSDQFGRCNDVLGESHELPLQKRAGNGDVPEDDGGHQVTTRESLTQDAEPNASSFFKASTTRLEELLKEIPVKPDDEYLKRMQSLLSTLNDLEIAEKNAEEQSRILLSAIDTASVSTERGRDEEITGSTNARSPIKLGTLKVAEAAEDRKEKKERFKAQRHARKLKRVVRGSGPVFVKAFPKNTADIKDWSDILEAMNRENVQRFTESFTFRGRSVPLEWRIASGDELRREFNRQVALVNRRLNDRTGGGSSTAGASTSTSTPDVVEEQKQDDGNCTACGQSDSPKKRIRSRRKK